MNLVKDAQQGHQMDDCRITNDEFGIVHNVLKCDGNENVYEYEVETYEEVLSFEEELLENVDESKDKEDILILLKKSQEIVDKINSHSKLCIEIFEMYQNPEISKYVEYYNCYYIMIKLFEDQLKAYGVNVKKNIFAQLENKTIDKQNILLRYFKIISEPCYTAKIDEEIKEFIQKHKQYKREEKEIDEM